MDTTHATPARDGRLVFIEPADTAPLTAAERATLQTAFAALLRSGRPLFAPPAPDAVPGPLDPDADQLVIEYTPGQGQKSTALQEWLRRFPILRALVPQQHTLALNRP